MILGEEYAVTRDFPNASQEMEKAIALDPKHVEAYVALAAVYRAADRTSDAEAVYAKAIEANPKSSLARIARAQFYFSRQKMEEAQRELEVAANLDPRGVSPRLMLGTVLIARGCEDQAERLYASLKTLAPEDPQAYRALANYYSSSGQREKAVAELKSLAAAKPKDISVKVALVDTLLDLQRLNEAEAALEEPLKKNSENPRLLLAEGRILLANRNYQKAILTLQKLAKAEPGSAQGFYFLGVAQEGAGLPDSAKISFSRSLELSPQMSQAQAALADLNAKAHQQDEAVRQADLAIGKNPGLASPYVSKARALIDTGDLKQGAALLQEALRRDPGSQAALAVLLKLSVNQGNTQEVLKRISEMRDNTTVRLMMMSLPPNHSVAES